MESFKTKRLPNASSRTRTLQPFGNHSHRAQNKGFKLGLGRWLTVYRFNNKCDVALSHTKAIAEPSIVHTVIPASYLGTYVADASTEHSTSPPCSTQHANTKKKLMHFGAITAC